MISSNDAFRNKLLEDNKAEEDAINKKKIVQAKKKEKYRLRQRAINKAKIIDDNNKPKDEEGIINIENLGYRDRVLERKKGVSNEVNAAEADWEKYKKLTVNESMYLGGDESTTHLVKGLDIQLANRIKKELKDNNKSKEEEVVIKGINKGDNSINTNMGKNIAKVLFGKLHPNRYGIKYIIQKQTKMIGEMSINAKIKGSSRKFINGTCYYKMNIDPYDNEDIIPMEIYESTRTRRRRSRIINNDNGDYDDDYDYNIDNKLYVSRYNEDILTQARISSILLRNNNIGIYKGKGDKGKEVHKIDGYEKIIISNNKKEDGAIDNDVNIFDDDNNKDNSINNNNNLWDKNIQDNNRNYFDKMITPPNNDIIDNNEVNKLREAVNKHLINKRRLQNNKEEYDNNDVIISDDESIITMLNNKDIKKKNSGDFLSNGDYDECYVNYGELKGFGHDVGINKDILKYKGGNNKRGNNKKRSNNNDDNEGDGKKKSKMGETAQLKAVMKKVKEIEENKG